ncbi:hypothetical protein [Erythrobacter sp. MTPC3]|uniref:hypothetical protein n=1 Tax=Erythrobacter sp. MTPC3 TaxID=3056564 RepID=UPI0036F27039
MTDRQAAEALQPSETGAPDAIPVPTFEDDGFYDDASIPSVTANDAAPSAAPDFQPAVEQAGGGTSWLTWAIGLLVILLAAIGGLLWWRKRAAPGAGRAQSVNAAAMTAGVRQMIAAQRSDFTTGKTSPSAPPAPMRERTAAAPPKLDLQVSIVAASRSVMKFTAQYRIEIRNRSDFAVRGITVDPVLSSARRDTEMKPGSNGAELHMIERIGPHQARTVTGELQMPWSEVSAFRQANTPVFVPMLLVTLACEGLKSQTRKFVVGTPSAVSGARLHPIPLDTPPGGMTGLRAQEVKEPAAA